MSGWVAGRQGNEPVFVKFKIVKEHYPDHFLWLRVEGICRRPSGRSDDSRDGSDSRSRSPLPSARSHRRTEPPAAHEHSHAMNRQQRAAAEHHRSSSSGSWRPRGTTESVRSWGNERWSYTDRDLRGHGNHNSDSRPNSRSPRSDTSQAMRDGATPPERNPWISPRENPPDTSMSPWAAWCQ